MSKEYICMCGREFDTKHQLSGHHSHCEIFLTHTGRLHIRKAVDCANRAKTSKTLKEKYRIEKEQKLKEWVDSKPRCEICGKIMTEKFGSGRFCSKKCANTRSHSDETRAKIATKSKQNAPRQMAARRIKDVERYMKNPKRCKVCGCILPYDLRERKTCGEKCTKQLISANSRESAQQKGGNNNVQGVRGTAHYGTYKGIHCDSSFELAFVIYCLEHNIEFERNMQGFNYVFNNENKKYFPDFIVNGTYVEIKNYWSEQVQAKIDCFPENLILKTFYKKDLKPCIQYCIHKYGKNFTELYDKNYPSWMDKRDKKNVA